MKYLHPKTVRERQAAISDRIAELESRSDSIRERILQTRFGDSSAQERDAILKEFDQNGRELEAISKESNEIGELLRGSVAWFYDALKQIFTLSTGALALSITFHSNLVPDDPQQIELIRYAWIGFASSVIAYPLSLLVRATIEADIFPRLLGFGSYTALALAVLGGFVVGSSSLLRFALSNYPAG